MKILVLTNEYPPNIYGGAGVHVEYLVRELAAAKGNEICVLCFGEQQARQKNLRVQGVDPLLEHSTAHLRLPSLLRTLMRQVAMTGAADEADIVHCHTWYTHLAGCLIRQLTGARLVLTTHSLEPHRPWKIEQLGASYNASSWMEKTAYENADGVIAVSRSMQQDVQRLYGVSPERVRVIHNGIDTDEYRNRQDPEILLRYGIDAGRPYILFVGRITRQKGIFHLLTALPHLAPDTQVVLCAGAADTEELQTEMSKRVEEAKSRSRCRVVWIPQMVPKPDIIAIYSGAALFICPSIYEPFGIINLEAMACGTPVVASATGGIPEIVVHGETGLLVPFRPSAPDNPEPEKPEEFSLNLAAALNELMRSQDRRRAMGVKARFRVEEHFSWKSVARKTLAFYQELLEENR